MTRPSYGRFPDTVNVPTEILASTVGLEKIGILIDNASAGVAASLTTSCTGTNNDLVFTAKTPGVVGNQIEIAYTDTDQASTTVSVADGVITVDLATSGGNPVATATEVKAAVEAHPIASKLVSVALKPGDDGTGIVTAFSATNLSGGVDPDSVTKYVKGTVMGMVTATGLYKPYDDSASDGTQVAKGILADDVDASTTDQNDLRLTGVMYIHGSFVEANLIGLDANAKTDLGGRSVGPVFTF